MNSKVSLSPQWVPATPESILVPVQSNRFDSPPPDMALPAPASDNLPSDWTSERTKSSDKNKSVKLPPILSLLESLQNEESSNNQVSQLHRPPTFPSSRTASSYTSPNLTFSQNEANQVSRSTSRPPSPLQLDSDLNLPSVRKPRKADQTTSVRKKPSRKESHSVIERRRREKINDCLIKLRNLVPGCRHQLEQKELQSLTKLKSTKAVGSRRSPRTTSSGVHFGESDSSFTVVGLHKLDILVATIDYIEMLHSRLQQVERTSPTIPEKISKESLLPSTLLQLENQTCEEDGAAAATLLAFASPPNALRAVDAVMA